MSQSRLAYLLNKYINKENTTEEKDELFQLINTQEVNGELEDLLGKIIENTQAEMYLSETSGDKILQAVIGQAQAQHSIEVPSVKKRNVFVFTSIAAAFVVLLGLFAYFFLFTNKKVKAADEFSAFKNTGQQLLYVSTTTGEGKNIHLPDGTEVWLSPSSCIEYPRVFTEALREVTLSGEAFFEVAHDKKHPFIIHSGSIETKVLGTSFNIQAYDGQDDIKVTVVSGKVNVTSKAKVENVELVANERAVFHRKTIALIKENADTVAAPVMLKRKAGEFVYEAEHVQKVIDDLHEYFGINIQVADAIKTCPVNLNFYLTDKIEEILEPIALTINGSVQKKGNVFFIDGKACPK